MASKAPMRDWPLVELAPQKIQLDPQNPRIDATLKTSQPKLRELLLEYAKVMELVQSLALDGILPAENIIVVREGGQDVVIEGNRRVCACQLILDPACRPPGFKKNFPVVSEEAFASILKLKAIRAPSREAAERLITKKHTAPGIQQWGPVAKQRRISRLIQTGSSILDVAEQFGMKSSEVLKLVREFNLLERARRLKCWSKEDRERLDDPTLKVNPFTRFFSLGGAKEVLRLSFDDEGGIITTLESSLLDLAFELIARELLLGGKESLGTRATSEDVFSKVFLGHPKLQALQTNRPQKPTEAPKNVKGGPRQGDAPPPPPPPGGTNNPPPPGGPGGPPPPGGPGGPPDGGAPGGKPSKPKADIFFESLRCLVADQSLVRVTKEIAGISSSLKTYPTAATFLLRALLERALWFCIEKKGLEGDLRNFLRQKPPKPPPGNPPPPPSGNLPPPGNPPPPGDAPSDPPPPGDSPPPGNPPPPGDSPPPGNPPPPQTEPTPQVKDPGLEAVVRYCLKNHTRIFVDTRVEGVLNHMMSQKAFMDMVIHGKWMHADEASLRTIANKTRTTFQKILDGSALIP